MTATFASIVVGVALLFLSAPALAQFIQQGPKLVGTGAAGSARQGSSVALSADGNTALVGGSTENAAWVFTRSGDVWTQQGPKLVGAGFSVALSADGNTAIAGRPGAAFVYTRSGGVWTQQGPTLIGTGAVGDSFQGQSVALSADGNTAVLGGPRDNGGIGAAWVFTRSGGVWTQQGPKLVGSGAPGIAEQGSSVALSADGNTLVIGGPGDNNFAGAAWVFTRSGGVWTQQGPKLVGTGAVGNAQQGSSVALSADGNTAMLVGVRDNASGMDAVGAAWVFTRSGGMWTQQGPKLLGSGPIGADATTRTSSVALSADGNIALVGGPRDNFVFSVGTTGSAYLFTRIGGVWTLQQELVGIGTVGAAAQGTSVALAADGNTALVGGSSDNSFAGATWVFALPPGSGLTCPLASQFGDFNGDGRDDLLFRLQTGHLTELLMNGFQITSVQSIGAVAAELTVVAVADFNGDGRADILLRRTTDGLLALFLMNGAQIVAAELIGVIGTEWQIVGAADFNGDGRADIVLRRESDGMLSLFLMSGAQVVAAQLLGAVGPEWRVRGVRDFNGDGRADILFRRTGDGMLSLFLFNSFQLLGAQLLGGVGVEFELLGVRDFNGDGRADLLFRRAGDGLLTLYLMNGFQVLAAQAIGVVGTEFTLLGLGDLNGDGRADMVFRRTSDGLLSAFLMSGAGVIGAQFLASIGTGPTACFGQPPLASIQR